ncbi:DUF485 domain-containing protein [Piscinibacter sp. XHJ-5]|uniref:DUF485 domain-containing protein n=1 Tax=Piscinibacter sp. XHJ-5 TaxID=3037797 RepID=UPI002453573E|nr:DUF485 domain-containing protein [Piscinibacter sp. XHJ-5]
MHADLVSRIASDPNYQALEARRRRFGWVLTVLMLVVYYGFILLVAFGKPFLSQPLGAGVTTIGIPIGLGVIVFTVLITGLYVRRANSEFDTLTEQVVEGALK